MENQIIVQKIAQTLNLPEKLVANTMELLDEGATIPFMARYRKERTGGLDEVILSQIKEWYEKFKELVKRKETVLNTIREQGKLTDELEKRIVDCWDANELEDLYLPFKPKRRTKAQLAKEAGLEPLAELILRQRDNHVEAQAERYVCEAFPDTAKALQGAKDILAEKMSEDENVRKLIRKEFARQAMIVSKVVKNAQDLDEASKFSDYFSFSEPLKRCSSHRLLAMRRGESLGILKVSIAPADENEGIEKIRRMYVRGSGACSDLVSEAVDDAYKRLIKPSIETEFAAISKEKADEEAIGVFAENLRQLLLSPPLGRKRVMGIDPGFRTGCKVVCLDEQGNLLHFETIYPNPPRSEYIPSVKTVERLAEQYRIEAIAIGNGTASRETSNFIKRVHFRTDVQAFVVSEDGASIYSASKIAREEFPDQDITVRGAVSIGRRLLDPLAELVKIDPKSIGVGQYQHDVDQNLLKQKLDSTVESCVNLVGVNVNTASQNLLTYVSGLGPQLAKNIVDYRKANGRFDSRNDLMRVPRLGPHAFEQCAGFLRVPDSSNPLDNSAVHPESYAIVEQMAADCQCSVSDLIKTKDKREQIKIEKYITDRVGLPTLNDILKELEKPGLDPRSEIEVFEFDERVHTVDDLEEGMILPGIVTNITNFGAFVDIGVHQDGLVHISQMADKYVSDPNKVLKLHQHIRVRVLEVDHRRKRISLTLKGITNK